jgi:hypothetical protein
LFLFPSAAPGRRPRFEGSSALMGLISLRAEVWRPRKPFRKGACSPCVSLQLLRTTIPGGTG